MSSKRFEDIREAVTAGRVDAATRDAFVLVGPAGALLKELMPDEAPKKRRRRKKSGAAGKPAAADQPDEAVQIALPIE